MRDSVRLAGLVGFGAVAVFGACLYRNWMTERKRAETQGQALAPRLFWSTFDSAIGSKVGLYLTPSLVGPRHPQTQAARCVYRLQWGTTDPSGQFVGRVQTLDTFRSLRQSRCVHLVADRFRLWGLVYSGRLLGRPDDVLVRVRYQGNRIAPYAGRSGLRPECVAFCGYGLRGVAVDRDETPLDFDGDGARDILCVFRDSPHSDLRFAIGFDGLETISTMPALDWPAASRGCPDWTDEPTTVCLVSGGRPDRCSRIALTRAGWLLVLECVGRQRLRVVCSGRRDALIDGFYWPRLLHRLHRVELDGVGDRPRAVRHFDMELLCRLPPDVIDVRVVDANGDGAPDLVVLCQPYLLVLLNRGAADGSPRFAARVVYLGEFFASHLLCADFTGDGRLDIAVHGSAILLGQTAWRFLIGEPNTFRQGAEIDCTGPDMDVGAVADLDNDGTAELLRGSFWRLTERVSYGRPVRVASLCDRKPTVDRMELLGVTTCVVADLDGDGRPDAAFWGWAHPDGRDPHDLLGLRCGPVVWVSIGGGRMTPRWLHVRKQLRDVGSLAVGDLNADGAPDLVTTGDDVRVWLNRGDATFSQSLTVPARGAQALVADIDGDRRGDLVLDGYVLYQQPDIGLTERKPLVGVGQAGARRAADLNGDGKADLVAIRDGGLVVFQNVSAGRRPRFIEHVLIEPRP